MAARVARAEPNLLNRLAEGIASIGDHFDVVILDPPPALGTISLSVMRAANALLVPIPPTVVDFTSTTSFLAMLYETMLTLAGESSADRFALDAPNRNAGRRAEIHAAGAARADAEPVRGLLLRTVLKDSAEIDNALGPADDGL